MDDPAFLNIAPVNPTARNGKPPDCTECWEMGKCHVGRTAIPLNHGSAVFCMYYPSVWLTQMDTYSFLSSYRLKKNSDLKKACMWVS